MIQSPPSPGSDAIVRLLERHRILEGLATRQQTDRRDLLVQMQRRENLVELRRRLLDVHPADLAALLPRIEPGDRALVFRQLPPRAAGRSLVELDAEIIAGLVDDLEAHELLAAIAELDADDLTYLSDRLPRPVVERAWMALNKAGRSTGIDAMAYASDAVGRLMRRDAIALRDDQSAGDVLAMLRRGGELPEQTDRLFVTDARHVLRGSLRLQDLVRATPEARLADLMTPPGAAFQPAHPARDAARAFERYDLVSAPVVDDAGKLVGRLTIDAVVDYLRAASQQEALTRAGLQGAEDLFAPVSESLANRWPWLAINLLTAFVASRVIGLFEDTIQHVVALAALMPVVASIGGNTGNQTVALVIRAMALDQMGADHGRRVLRKELAVAAASGTAWGAVVGLLAWWLYCNTTLAAVIAAAVFLNLIVAAVAGVAVPIGLRRTGRDPAHGASVLLTFVTDGMGFFLFLGLAAALLT